MAPAETEPRRPLIKKSIVTVMMGLTMAGVLNPTAGPTGSDIETMVMSVRRRPKGAGVWNDDLPWPTKDDDNPQTDIHTDISERCAGGLSDLDEAVRRFRGTNYFLGPEARLVDLLGDEEEKGIIEDIVAKLLVTPEFYQVSTDRGVIESWRGTLRNTAAGRHLANDLEDMQGCIWEHLRWKDIQSRLANPKVWGDFDPKKYLIDVRKLREKDSADDKPCR